MRAQNPPTNAQLGSTDYEGIASHVQDTLEESMTVIVRSQTVLKTALEIKIMELKTLLQCAAQTSSTTTTSRTSRGDSTSQGRTRLVRILPTSVKLPLGSPIEQTRFIEVDLAGILTDTLQIVQVQVQEELRDREVVT